MAHVNTSATPKPTPNLMQIYPQGDFWANG